MTAGDEPLQINLLGGLEVRRGEAVLALPTSRKARALLGFLLLTGKPQRRDRLCDIFWEVPDDPRGALRSALSKLRPLVNDAGAERLVADRERVALHRRGAAVDYLDLLDGTGGDAEALDQELLAGLDLPNQPEYQAWLTAMRGEAEALRGRLGAAIAARMPPPGMPPPGGPRPPAALATSPYLARQRIGFSTAPDGARIAHASVGEGPVLVKAANWLNHLEHDWDSPVWAPLFQELARDHRFVRYDERGNGMSDWDVTDLGFDAFVTDLECVVEASDCGAFPLLGLSQGCAVAIEYAARHPERVTRLVLWGGYAAGWRIDGDDAVRAERQALITLVRQGWGRDDPSYRQIFSRAFMPTATPAELASFDAFQRVTTSPENAARFLETFADIDVRHRLADVRAPTLVMHARGDRRVPLEQGAQIAAGIAGAEFVTLPTDNHLLLGREPASGLFLAHVRQFLAA
jgi:pimeloyl-ACP methyl ester carboxylesterase